MCFVLDLSAWGTETEYISGEYYNSGIEFRFDYWNVNSIFHALAICYKRQYRGTDVWNITSYEPRLLTKKHGWCITYMDTYPDYKWHEGWYSNGKREGEHRSYAITSRNGNFFNYLSTTTMYKNDKNKT